MTHTISPWNFGRRFPVNHHSFSFSTQNLSGKNARRKLRWNTVPCEAHQAPRTLNCLRSLQIWLCLNKMGKPPSLERPQFWVNIPHQTSHVIGVLALVLLLLHLLTYDLPQHCNLDFLERRGNGVAKASTVDVSGEVTTFPCLHPLKSYPLMCKCIFCLLYEL